MIKKIITTTVLFVFLTIGTASAWMVNYIPTDVGIIPAEQAFGYVIHPDTFYKDFTK